MNCDQCSAARINGVFCHESGCPNSGKTWDSEREEWIKFVDCYVCGCPVEVGNHCDCQDIEDDFDYDFEGDEDELDEDLY